MAEIPHLRELHDRFAERGFRIVTVSFDVSRDTVRSFLTRQPMPWAQAYAGEGWPARGPVGSAYRIHALPSKLLVGPEGRIIALDGGLGDEELEQLLERRLPSSPRQGVGHDR